MSPIKVKTIIDITRSNITIPKNTEFLIHEREYDYAIRNNTYLDNLLYNGLYYSLYSKDLKKVLDTNIESNVISKLKENDTVSSILDEIVIIKAIHDCKAVSDNKRDILNISKDKTFNISKFAWNYKATGEIFIPNDRNIKIYADRSNFELVENSPIIGEYKSKEDTINTDYYDHVIITPKEDFTYYGEHIHRNLQLLVERIKWDDTYNNINIEFTINNNTKRLIVPKNYFRSIRSVNKEDYFKGINSRPSIHDLLIRNPSNHINKSPNIIPFNSTTNHIFDETPIRSKNTSDRCLAMMMAYFSVDSKKNTTSTNYVTIPKKIKELKKIIVYPMKYIKF